MTGATVEGQAGGRVGAAVIERWLIDLFLFAVVVQFFLAGLGVFRARPDGHQRLAESTVLDPHRALGTGLQGLALIILALAVVARKQVRESVALLVLMILQSVWASAGTSAAVLGGIHVLGGVAIAALAYRMHRTAHAAASAAG